MMTNALTEKFAIWKMQNALFLVVRKILNTFIDMFAL